jgi:hypothetical protein
VTTTDLLADAIADRVIARLRETHPSSQVKPTPRLLDVKSAADYLSRTPKAVRRLIDSGKLPVVRMDSRIYLDSVDLDRVIQASKEDRPILEEHRR